IFISIHADSLHHSLRGAMVYVPATGLTKGAYGKTGSVYTSRSEVREQPRVSFSWKERTRSEGFSRQLAESILGAFKKRGLRVHKEKPIRDRIIRCRRCRAFVPAVIRRNAVPAKVLLEICNMNNAADRKLLRTRAFRQKVAQSLVDAILEYYGQPPLGDPPPRVADSGSSPPATR
ncbi:MAG: N-acetylmuramoyl-L-alanine amidase, partial [Acidobacteriota bacterium]